MSKPTSPPTPPPRPADFGVLLASVKDDLNEIKPDVKQTREAVSSLRTDMDNTKGRVSTLEKRTEGLKSHSVAECPNTSAVAELKEESKSLTLHVNTAEVKIQEHTADIEIVNSKDSKRIYWLLGIAVVALGAVGGWLVTFATVRNDVGHLQRDQTKIWTNLSALTKAHNTQTEEVTKATEAVEAAVVEVKNGRRAPTFDTWFQSLSTTEKKLLQRQWRTERLSPPPPGVDVSIE